MPALAEVPEHWHSLSCFPCRPWPCCQLCAEVLAMAPEGAFGSAPSWSTALPQFHHLPQTQEMQRRMWQKNWEMHQEDNKKKPLKPCYNLLRRKILNIESYQWLVTGCMLLVGAADFCSQSCEWNSCFSNTVLKSGSNRLSANENRMIMLLQESIMGGQIAEEVFYNWSREDLQNTYLKRVAPLAEGNLTWKMCLQLLNKL